MYYYIVQLLFLLPAGDPLVMPLVGVGPQTIEECHSIGNAATEYAQSLSESGNVTIPIPDGRVLTATPVGWACTPAEWFIPAEEPEA